MLKPIEAEFTAANFPAGKAASQLANVRFCILPFAQAKQLHNFPRVVFVRMRFSVRRGIQIDQHRGIARNLEQQAGEIPKSRFTQQLILSPHQFWISNFVSPCGKMPSPFPATGPE